MQSKAIQENMTGQTHHCYEEQKSIPFGNEDMVKGSGYITRQSCGSNEIELERFMPEMGITRFSDIDRYTLDDAKVKR